MSAPNINIPPPVTPALPPVVGRRRNTGLIIGIVVASVSSAVLAVGAGVTVSRLRADRSASGVHSGDIRDEMLPLPAGSSAWAQTIGTDGMLSADQADEYIGSRPPARSSARSHCRVDPRRRSATARRSSIRL